MLKSFRDAKYQYNETVNLKWSYTSIIFCIFKMKFLISMVLFEHGMPHLKSLTHHTHTQTAPHTSTTAPSPAAPAAAAARARPTPMT